jgi:hypothetical protein
MSETRQKEHVTEQRSSRLWTRLTDRRSRLTIVCQEILLALVYLLTILIASHFLRTPANPVHGPLPLAPGGAYFALPMLEQDGLSRLACYT